MKFNDMVENLIINAISIAKEKEHEYVTPEHLLLAIVNNKEFQESFNKSGGNSKKLKKDLENYLENELDSDCKGDPEISFSFNEVLSFATLKATSCDKDVIELPHIISGILNLRESNAAYFVEKQGVKQINLIRELINYEDEYSSSSEDVKKDSSMQKEEKEWLKYVTCLNEEVYDKTPLIGRKNELERTMEILCRKSKNNPIHVGEAGVGKTTITMGLTKLINEGNVPEKLKNAKIYSIELSTVLAGTQYRGDFEKRLKLIMDGISTIENPIVYIDEIHNIVGAGATNGGALDASNILKPYFADGKIKFIGATTYEEYNKYFAKSKSLLRRFQKVQIKEPSIDETIEILNGLKKYYEDFHKVRYLKGTIEHAVILSDKYITERFLPDKAIDLIDEAGAYREMHLQNKKRQTVDKKLIEEVLSKICNVPKQTVEADESKKLKNIDKIIKSQVFGQDEAVFNVTEAIKLSRAGLNDDNKPVASLLFVGPTGVGKTEIAKVLAKTLNIELIRFDMSEYAEKHTISKLIGSPAGYVGYEEGGLLTDAVRKNPHCVLLLDEIEKAHSDIYNILLQVMDYANLTDSKGRKTDFRNVILIMTSNAGASKVNKSLIGFGERKVKRENMIDEVKKIFNPEFRNRLTKVIIFNDIDDAMAEKITLKQFDILNKKLMNKNVEVVPNKECINYIINKGVSVEFGAREIQRIINNEIKFKMADSILFGKLKKGGKCEAYIKDNKISIKIL